MFPRIELRLQKERFAPRTDPASALSLHYSSINTGPMNSIQGKASRILPASMGLQILRYVLWQLILTFRQVLSSHHTSILKLYQSTKLVCRDEVFINFFLSPVLDIKNWNWYANLNYIL